MADAESIKRALGALEDEIAWAVNLADCLMAAAGDSQGLRESPFVNRFHYTVDQLAQRVDQLASAIHGR